MSSNFLFDKYCVHQIQIPAVSYLEDELNVDLAFTDRHEFRAVASAGTWTTRTTGRSAFNRHSSTVHPGKYREH